MATPGFRTWATSRSIVMPLKDMGKNGKGIGLGERVSFGIC